MYTVADYIEEKEVYKAGLAKSLGISRQLLNYWASKDYQIVELNDKLVIIKVIKVLEVLEEEEEEHG